MNYFDRRKLKKLARKAVIQGNHKQRITQFYEVLVKEAREEFSEDTKDALDMFLRECHKKALDV